MQNFYKGDEIKFEIDLSAPGFSMDDDDFEIEVATKKSSIKGFKGDTHDPEDPDVPIVIFKEAVGGDPTDSDSSEEEPVEKWFAIADTSTLTIGPMRVIATAHVVDPNANDGIRKQIAVDDLGNLVNP